MLQHNVAAVPLCAIDRIVRLQNALWGIDVAVGIHPTITALNFHLQLARLDLAKPAISEPLKARPCPLRIQLTPFYSTAVLGLLWIGSV